MNPLRLPTPHLTNGFLLITPPMSLVSFSFPSISHRIQIRTLVVCARRRKRKTVGNPRFTRFLFKSLSLLSSNLQIIPPPLDLVIADLCGVDGRGGGGDGGGLGFWRGWGRFDGWRRKRNKVPFLILVCVVVWICGFCRISGREIKSDEVLKALGICLFGVAMLKQLKREATSLVFVLLLCFTAALGFGFKKDTLVKLASSVRSASSLLFRKKRSRRRG